MTSRERPLRGLSDPPTGPLSVWPEEDKASLVEMRRSPPEEAGRCLEDERARPQAGAAAGLGWEGQTSSVDTSSPFFSR